ncbi:carboxypeptidase B-like [Limulus polyphemus]|uniref:Carboxypeptidase B-like n=1 Tax=Limulus polyphemus TaxID=6850 RepID=A0ABM1TFP6_LIMPO|nr:carboxypeptidase B-like [Limulus polyphemus]
MCSPNMKIVLSLLVLLGLYFFSDALDLYRHRSHEKRYYRGYKVLRLYPSNSEQLRLLHDLAESENSELDFWLPPSSVSRPVDVMIPPERFHQIKHLLTANHIQQEILVEDVDKAIENEKTPAPYSELRSTSSVFFTKYQRINDIHNYLENLAAENSPIASILSIGKSYEERDLKAIKISKETSNDKPIIWIDAGIHAREWISIATAVYIAKELIQNYNSDPDIKSLVDTFEWYILPSVNPDGYEYSHDYNRMWRKTRSVGTSVWGCIGVDANRNFGFKWNQGGASSNPCSDLYAGPKAFSEPETKAISEFILARKNQVKLYIATHSYSQLWLTPWGWTSKLPDDYDDQYNLANIAVKALNSVHGTKYQIGSSTNLLYIAAGGADDWAYGVAGIKYAYTPELRDTGRYGFVLPASQIIPSGEETFAAVKAMALALKNELSRGLI